MLRKRTRSTQKDQMIRQIRTDGGFDSETGLQSDFLGQRQKTNTFFNVPGLFVGLSPKSVLECDSVRSPTSPFDFKLFSFRFPKSPFEGHQKSWGSNKVGLGSIVDSFDDYNDDGRNLPEKSIPLSNSKTILIGSQIRSKASNSPKCGDFREAPKSLPKNYPIFLNSKLRPSNLQKGSSDILFEIGGDPLETEPFELIQSFSLDSKRLGSEIHRRGSRNVDLGSENNMIFGPILIGNGDEIARSLSPEEIELSEDYTCVISHGPVPKTTHIFGDLVLECHPNGVDFENKRGSLEEAKTLFSEKCSSRAFAPGSPYPTDDFLSFCCYCKKKLEVGKDIYMYRGEKAFCSGECRLEEISIEEEREKSLTNIPKSKHGDDISDKSIFVAISSITKINYLMALIIL